MLNKIKRGLVVVTLVLVNIILGYVILNLHYYTETVRMSLGFFK